MNFEPCSTIVINIASSYTDTIRFIIHLYPGYKVIYLKTPGLDTLIDPPRYDNQSRLDGSIKDQLGGRGSHVLIFTN